MGHASIGAANRIAKQGLAAVFAVLRIGGPDLGFCVAATRGRLALAFN
jgi:hypothetical protein